jgi:SAM-dependent methyltransferase
MLRRDLPKSTPQLVLDVHAGSGRTSTALLARLHEGFRVLALEPDPALVALGPRPTPMEATRPFQRMWHGAPRRDA